MPQQLFNAGAATTCISLLLAMGLGSCKQGGSGSANTESAGGDGRCIPSATDEFKCWTDYSQWQKAAKNFVPDQADYELVKAPSDGIETVMKAGTAAQNIPPQLQGIWWMDGNPQPHMLVSFYNTNYNPATRTAMLPEWGANNYTWFADSRGENGYRQALALNQIYQVQFNEALDFGTITMGINAFGRQLFVPRRLLNFTMKLVEDGHWLRESSVLGIKIPNYDFRRIVKGSGEHDPAYKDYVATVAPFSYVPQLRAGYKPPPAFDPPPSSTGN